MCTQAGVGGAVCAGAQSNAAETGNDFIVMSGYEVLRFSDVTKLSITDESCADAFLQFILIKYAQAVVRRNPDIEQQVIVAEMVLVDAYIGADVKQGSDQLLRDRTCARQHRGDPASNAQQLLNRVQWTYRRSGLMLLPRSAAPHNRFPDAAVRSGTAVQVCLYVVLFRVVVHGRL